MNDAPESMSDRPASPPFAFSPAVTACSTSGRVSAGWASAEVAHAATARVKSAVLILTACRLLCPTPGEVHGATETSFGRLGSMPFESEQAGCRVTGRATLLINPAIRAPTV